MRSDTTETVLDANVGLDTTVVAKRDLLGCDINGEAILLDTTSGIYFGLNAVGSRIWTLIQSPRDLSSVRDTLLEEYDVTVSACEAELLRFVRDLLSRELVEIRP